MSNSRPLAAWMVMMVTLSPCVGLVIVHDQADVLEEGAERSHIPPSPGRARRGFRGGRRFRPSGRPGASRCSRSRRARCGRARDGGGSSSIPRQRAKSATRWPSARRACGVKLVAIEHLRGGEQQRQLGGAGVAVDGGDRLVAEPALGGVDDPLEGEIVGGLGDDAQVGEGVADLGALVEAEAADDPVVEADRDEAVLELAGLELGADEDRDVGRAGRPRARALSISSPMRRASSGPSQTPITRTLSPSPLVGPQASCRAGRHSARSGRRRRQDVRGRAVVLLEPDDRRAGKVLFEAQDVGDLGAPPRIDRLVVVADAAEVAARLGEQPQPFDTGRWLVS